MNERLLSMYDQKHKEITIYYRLSGVLTLLNKIHYSLNVNYKIT
jgi:hypothetical protein